MEYIPIVKQLVAIIKNQTDLKFKSLFEPGSAGHLPHSVSPDGAKNCFALMEAFPGIIADGNDIDVREGFVNTNGVKIYAGDMYKKLTNIKDKSYDMVLISKSLFCANDEQAQGLIDNAKRIAKKYIVILDFHDETIKSQEVEKGRWKRNYKLYFPDNKIVVVKSGVPIEWWPGKNYEQYNLESSVLFVYL